MSRSSSSGSGWSLASRWSCSRRRQCWTFTTQRMYTSSVNLQIDPEQSVLPYKEIYDSVTADPRYLGTQAQVLKSEALARRIVMR